MEQSLHQRRPNLDNIPDDIASILAEQIFEWGEVSRDKFGFAGGNAGWPLISGRDDEDKRAAILRNSTLRSLFLLDHRSKDVWYRFLLRNIRLESDQLPSFLSLLEKEPHLGEYIHHLTFSDDPKMAPHTQEIVAHRTADLEVPMGNEELREYGLRVGYDVVCSDQVTEYLFSSSEDLAIIQAGALQLESDSNSQAMTAASKRILMLARSKVVDLSPNLKSISMEGFNSSIIFFKRVGNQLLVLEGLRSLGLRSINFGRQSSMGMELSLENVAFLLLNLRNLHDANLEAFLDGDTTDFFIGHSDFWDNHHSKLKQLSLELSCHASGHQFNSINIRSILSFTKDLELLSLKCMASNPSFLPTVHIFDSLSLVKLTRLELRGVGYYAHPPRLRNNCLSNLLSVKTFAFDAHLLKGIHRSLARTIDPDFDSSSFKSKIPPDFQIFPQNVEHLLILSNYDFSFQDSVHQPEATVFLALGFLPAVNSLKCISTPTLPRSEEKNHPGALKNKNWTKARERLETACLRYRLRLDQVDLNHKEPAASLSHGRHGNCDCNQ